MVDSTGVTIDGGRVVGRFFPEEFFEQGTIDRAVPIEQLSEFPETRLLVIAELLLGKDEWRGRGGRRQ